ncbi:MAG TPA: haloalkane dehalogenase [Ktedonobacteraceae bacterium]|jgi:haloalkane dehalogenase|nr:haloalkane dehalogenase [Ktedonobacteraceae bacterium]
MPVIRTPEERFANLPGFPFDPQYVEIHGLRMHYVDEGQGEVVFCLHGEPSWSYLYRKMIPILAVRNRVIAVDMIGFGRSDKFTERHEYSFQMHHDMLVGFIEALDLWDVTLVVQDWGGLLGLTIASEIPERFARLVIMNTGLPTGDVPMSPGFMRWREFAVNSKDMSISRVIQNGVAQPEKLTPEILAAYDSPFLDISYKAGAMTFPLLVPIHPDDPGAAEMRQARKVLSSWEKPTLVMFSDKDPITRGGDRFFRALIPGAKDQPEIVISNAGHFLQEDKGEELAQHIQAFIERTPLRKKG